MGPKKEGGDADVEGTPFVHGTGSVGTTEGSTKEDTDVGNGGSDDVECLEVWERGRQSGR